MGRRHAKFKKMFYFLEERQNKGEPFSLEEMAEATGYKMSSIRTYYGKRLKGLLVVERDDDLYEARGVDAFDEDSFIDYLTQRSSPADLRQVQQVEDRGGEEALLEGLVTRSASLLGHALELYHRPHGDAQLHAALALMIEAWDLLLKVELAKIRGVEQLSRDEERHRALTLPEMLARFFPAPDDPVRRNLEWLLRLRSEHGYLLVPELVPYLSRLLQACASNFKLRWEAVAGRHLFTTGAGMLAMGADGEALSPEDFERRYGEVAGARVEELLEDLLLDEETLDLPTFCAPVDLHLALTPSREGDDIALASHDATRQAHEATRSDSPYPYDPSDAVHAINRRLPYDQRLTPTALEAIDHTHDVRAVRRSRYYARLDDPTRHRYSRAYVDWVVTNIAEDRGWLERARQRWQRSR